MDGIIIHVKSGSGKGLTTQVEKTASATGKTVVSYTPDINQSAAVLRGVRAKGFETFTDTNELLGFLEEFWK